MAAARGGWAAARFDDLLNLIPARLTAALIALSHARLALDPILRDAPFHRSPNAGWPAGAMAVVGLARPDVAWWAPVLGAVLGLLWMGRLLGRRLQGFTGDGLGATQQVCEVAFYLGLVMALPVSA